MIIAIPALSPLTVPDVLTLATVILLLLHEPPLVLVSVIFDASQTVCAPSIVPAIGNGLTVTICVSVAVPQPLVTE